MKSRGRPIYHLRIISLKVPKRSAHFKEFRDIMMSTKVLVEVMCSYESLRPSNLANESGLKFSRTGASLPYLV